MYVRCTHAAPHLFDLVAGAGDALRDALVGPDGGSELSVMLNNLLVQVMVTLLERLLQAPFLSLSVLDVIAVGESPGQDDHRHQGESQQAHVIVCYGWQSPGQDDHRHQGESQHAYVIVCYGWQNS